MTIDKENQQAIGNGQQELIPQLADIDDCKDMLFTASSVKYKIQDAVLFEREECAKLCDKHAGMLGKHIGDYIRKRTKGV